LKGRTKRREIGEVKWEKRGSGVRGRPRVGVGVLTQGTTLQRGLEKMGKPRRFASLGGSDVQRAGKEVKTERDDRAHSGCFSGGNELREKEDKKSHGGRSKRKRDVMGCPLIAS